MLISLIVLAVAAVAAAHYFRGGHSLEGTVCAFVAGAFALHSGYLILAALLPVLLFAVKAGALVGLAYLCARFVKRRALAR